VDGTHNKEVANKKKFIKKQISVANTKFKKEIQKEINELRKQNGRNEFEYYENDDNPDIMIDEETGEIKTINISKVDPDAGMFGNGEHERQFAYVDQVGCDRHGWTLGFDVNPGNMHDSKAFLPFFESTILKFNPKVICGAAA